MRNFFGRVGGLVASGIGPREFGLLAGLGLVGYGAGLVWPPAGLVLPGAVLLYVSIFGLKG